MRNDVWQDQEVPIKALSLWDENARFPDKYFKQTEKELIKYFLSKKEFKIKEFAEKIVNEFDLPQIEKVIVWQCEGELIVLEGNRRLTAYKLLNNPNLTEHVELQSFFRQLKNQITIDDDFTLECLITEEKEQGLRYLHRKHLDGNNEVSWGDSERAHQRAREGNANKKELFKVALTNIIKNLTLPEKMKEQILGPGFVTNFYRIIESRPAWELFGFNLDTNGNLSFTDADFEKKLMVIILDVLKQRDRSGNKIDSRSLNKNNKKEEYLKSIKGEDVSHVHEEIKKAQTTDIFGRETIIITQGGKQRSNQKSTIRYYLIPKTCILKINENKINNIYHELRDDLLLDDSKKSVPNAAGVLFRVFLEITLDYYAKQKGFEFNRNKTIAEKISAVTKHMEDNSFANKSQLKGIRKVTGDTSHILHFQNFHDYVHSFQVQPTPSSLKLKWDNVEEFFILVWKTLG